MDEEKYKTLELIIMCKKCGSFFEINSEAINWAALLNPSFNEFMEYVEGGCCKVCRCKDEKSS